MKTLITLAFASALALLPGAAGAAQQYLYKSWGADGSISYGSKPEPGATRVKRIGIQTLSPEQRRAAHRLLLMDQATIKQGDQMLQKEWQAVDDQITRAQQNLHDAEQALRNGAHPAAGRAARPRRRRLAAGREILRPHQAPGRRRQLGTQKARQGLPGAQ